jgi:hypothetical protein
MLPSRQSQTRIATSRHQRQFRLYEMMFQMLTRHRLKLLRLSIPALIVIE